MRKLQPTGRTSGRAGAVLSEVGKAQLGVRTFCAGTLIQFEFQLQQQSQAAIFRPSQIKLWWVTPCQAQGAETSAGRSTANASPGENPLVRYASARNILLLRFRYKQDSSHWRSGQPNHFAHLTVEKSKIFEQSTAYAKIWSCGSAAT